MGNTGTQDVGSVGASSSLITIDSPDSFSEVYNPDQGYDYEFDAIASSLPSDFSWTNQEASLYVEELGAGVMYPVQGGTTFDWRLITRPLPSVEDAPVWTAWAKVLGNSTTVQYGPGLALRNSSNGKFVQIMTNYDSADAAWYLAEWSDPQTYHATVNNGVIRGDKVRYIKVECDNGVYDISLSSDGIGWIPVKTNYTPFATFDEIGFGATNDQATGKSYVGLEFLRIRF